MPTKHARNGSLRTVQVIIIDMIWGLGFVNLHSGYFLRLVLIQIELVPYHTAVHGRIVMLLLLVGRLQYSLDGLGLFDIRPRRHRRYLHGGHGCVCALSNSSMPAAGLFGVADRTTFEFKLTQAA